MDFLSFLNSDLGTLTGRKLQLSESLHGVVIAGAGCSSRRNWRAAENPFRTRKYPVIQPAGPSIMSGAIRTISEYTNSRLKTRNTWPQGNYPHYQEDPIMDTAICLPKGTEPMRKPLTPTESFIWLHSRDLYNFPASVEEARNICKDLRIQRMLVELQGLACVILHEQRHKEDNFVCLIE